MSSRLPRGLRERYLPWYTVFAESLATIAPLSSTAALLTYTISLALASAPLAVLVGALIYAPWVFIGYTYSRSIASYGGTYEFARISAGPTVAGAVGWLYLMAYVAYVPAVTSYALQAVAPQLLPQRYLLALAALLSALMAYLVTSGSLRPLRFVLVTSVVEVGIIVALGLAVVSRTGLVRPQISTSPGNFIAASLTAAYAMAGGGSAFFLGSEARGGGRDVSSAFVTAFSLAAAALAFAAYYEVAAAGATNAGVAGLLSQTQYPGYAVALDYGGRPLAVLYLALTLLSVVGSSVGALVAAQRLASALGLRDLRASGAVVSAAALAPLLAGLAVGVGWQVYTASLLTSLAALFISHGALSALFTSYAGRMGVRRRLLGLAVAIPAIAVMIYGLYSEVLAAGGPWALVAVVASALIAVAGAFSGRRRPFA